MTRLRFTKAYYVNTRTGILGLVHAVCWFAFFVFCNMLRVIVCDGDSQFDQTMVSLRIWIDKFSYMLGSSRRGISKM